VKAAIAELEQELRTLDARRGLVASALDAVRRLSGQPVTRATGGLIVMAAVAKPAAKAGKRPIGRARTITPTPDQLAKAKALWTSGVQVGEIQKVLGLKSEGGVYYVASRERWPKRQTRKPTGQRRPPLAVGEAIGKPKAEATPKRRCEACAQITSTDPCSCGHPWEKTQ
jgi:hypothetical protein